VPLVCLHLSCSSIQPIDSLKGRAATSSFSQQFAPPPPPFDCSIKQPPSEVTGRPVDEIINEWNAELERRSRSFVKHAEALAQVRLPHSRE
jgi:hypothetical protein